MSTKNEREATDGFSATFRTTSGAMVGGTLALLYDISWVNPLLEERVELAVPINAVGVAILVSGGILPVGIP